MRYFTAPTNDEPVAGLASRREIYTNYIRILEKQLHDIISPIFFVASIIAALIFGAIDIANRSVSGVINEILIVLFLTVCIIGYGYWLGLKGKLDLSVNIILTTGFAASILIQIIWTFNQGIDTFAITDFAAFTLMIILTGALASQILLPAVSSISIIATIVIFIFAGHHSQSIVSLSKDPGVYFLTLISLVVYQVIFTAIMWVLRSSYRQNLGSLGYAYERSKQLEELKDQFISSVNHELRSPIMAMQMYLQTVYQEYEHMSPENIYSAIEHSYTIGNRLADLVESILSARRIDSEIKNIELAPLQLRAIVEESISLLGSSTTKQAPRDLHIHIDKALYVWADKVRLGQVIVNLLSNAIKYSPQGSPIEVDAKITDVTQSVSVAFLRNKTETHRMIELTVKDYGMGIPKDQIPLLFNRFVRLPRDLASNIVGNGLGLFISKTIVEASGGSIWVESSGVNKEGSTFHVLLPVPPEDSANLQIIAGAEAGQKS